MPVLFAAVLLFPKSFQLTLCVDKGWQTVLGALTSLPALFQNLRPSVGLSCPE